jgi:hypothetical protein
MRNVHKYTRPRAGRTNETHESRSTRFLLLLLLLELRYPKCLAYIQHIRRACVHASKFLSLSLSRSVSNYGIITRADLHKLGERGRYEIIDSPRSFLPAPVPFCNAESWNENK